MEGKKQKILTLLRSSLAILERHQHLKQSLSLLPYLANSRQGEGLYLFPCSKIFGNYCREQMDETEKMDNEADYSERIETCSMRNAKGSPSG